MPVSLPAPAPQCCRICLVRHGETDWNVERRLQGHEDIPLNITGLAQARATAYALKNEKFAAFYCSDLQRAYQTANAIAYPHESSVHPDAALRERHYGVFQGLTYDEVEKKYPDLYRQFRSRDADFALPGGGESLSSLIARLGATFSALARRHSGEQILVVTHGGVLDVVYRLATGMDFSRKRDFPIPNAALNWVDYCHGKWHVAAWAVPSQNGPALDELPTT